MPAPPREKRRQRRRELSCEGEGMKNFESLFAAYLIAWAIFFGFLLLNQARLSRLQDELARLKEQLRKEP